MHEYMSIFLVAEIGVNWDGNLHLAEEMMKNAREAGFNAVKFQAYETSAVKNHPERNRLEKTTISKDNIEDIDHLAKSVGIEWFCTPMFIEAVDLLKPFVKRFKIRELDGRPLLENKVSNLIERVLRTNKEIIVSSKKSPRNTKYFNNSQVKWLYCVPKYPCSLNDLDFRTIKDFDGFSNHCPQLLAPLSAAILGAQIIEVHITSDKSKNFIDNNVSFDYSETKELVKLIRLSESIRK